MFGKGHNFLISQFLNFQFLPILHRPAGVRDADGATHEVGHGKHLEDFGTGDANLVASAEVVADAVVAAEHHRGYEAEQLLGFYVERPGFVGGFVEGKKAVERLVVLGKYLFVHLRPVVVEFGN